jgi:hypothetical protein
MQYWGDSVSDPLGRGIGTAIGTAIARPIVKARLRRLVREASGYLNEGEKLVAPVGGGSRGGRVFLFLGLGVWAITLVTVTFIGDRIGSRAWVVFFGGFGAGLLLMLPAGIREQRLGVALTDRRLLVFRLRGMLGGHIRDVFIAVPRDEVSTELTSRFGLTVLRLEFAPATGAPPIQLDAGNVNAQIAQAIHLALRSSDGAQRSAGDVTDAPERPARDQISEHATQPVPTGPWKGRTWPLIALIAGAVVAALAVGGIFALSNDDKVRSASTTTTTATPTPSASTAATPTTASADQPVAESTQPGVLALGDSTAVTTVDAGAGVITVKSLKITTRPYDKSVGYPPEEGYFLAFTVSVKADTGFDVFEEDFYVKTSKGKRIEEGGGNSWDAVDFEDLLDAVLSAGERQTGFVVFDSPVKQGILAYAPNLEGGPIASWKF